ADGRDAALAVPGLQDGRLAPRGVGAGDDRRRLEARLVEEDEVGLAGLGLPDDAGSLLGPSVGDLLGVASPRWAFFCGLWLLQFGRRRISLRTCSTWYPTPKWRRIISATRWAP